MQTSTTRRSLARRAVVGAVIGVSLFAAGAAAARPKNLNTALDRPTDQGLFRVRIQSQANPIPTSRVHQWTVHVTDAAGAPLTGAELLVDGGMPEHHHGLPTAPRATAGPMPGDYVINGMKFSMTGWWELKLAMKATDGRADRITFNVVL